MTPIIDMTDFDGGPDGPPLIWGVTLDNGYRYQFFPDRALVYKGDATEASYTITFSGCDCPSAAYGKRPCKHEKPLTISSDSMEKEKESGVIITDPATASQSGMSSEDADSFFDLLNG